MADSRPPGVSVVICTNRPGGLEAAVASVLANVEPSFELVVVAQGEDAGWAEHELEGLRHDGRLRIVHDLGRGASRARNVGIAQTGGDYVLFTDDDCVVASDWIVKHLALYQERPEAMLVFGRVAAPDWYTGSEGMVPTFYPSSARGTARLHGRTVLGMSANMSARRALFDRIGGFDEQLGPGGRLMSAEDLDLSLRVTAAGMVVLADDRPRVVHAGGVRRRGAECQLLWQRDGIGFGALLAKHLRSGQWDAALVIVRALAAIGGEAALRVLRGRRPFGLQMTACLTRGALRGLGLGLRQPLARMGTGAIFVARR